MMMTMAMMMMTMLMINMMLTKIMMMMMMMMIMWLLMMITICVWNIVFESISPRMRLFNREDCKSLGEAAAAAKLREYFTDGSINPQSMIPLLCYVTLQFLQR